MAKAEGAHRALRILAPLAQSTRKRTCVACSSNLAQKIYVPPTSRDSGPDMPTVLALLAKEATLLRPSLSRLGLLAPSTPAPCSVGSDRNLGQAPGDPHLMQVFHHSQEDNGW